MRERSASQPSMTPRRFSPKTGQSAAGWGHTMWLQAQSVVGLIAIPLSAWALSERRAAIKPARLARILIAGIGLQVLIAGLMLNVPAARAAFDWADGLVAALQSATGSGMRL